MRKQKQKYLHDPENGQCGDCYRTALAILLDMNRDDVPHWVTPDNWKRWAVDVQPKYDAWLAERGLKELPVPLSGEHGLEAILSCSHAWWGNTPAMLTGESRSGCNHVVIIQDGEIVCDPSTADAGIIGPCNDGFFWITALIPVNPPAMLAAEIGRRMK